MKTRSGVGLFSAVLAGVVSFGNGQAVPQTEVAGNQHIDAVVKSLPVGSEMRSQLVKGDRGAGIRYRWMDQMQGLGVKRAKVFLDFIWKDSPEKIRVNRIAYFRSYDSNCSQITDRSELNSIATTGLEQELKKFAIAATAEKKWSQILPTPEANSGAAVIEVLDDEWLPPGEGSVIPVDASRPRSKILPDGDVRNLQSVIVSGSFSQHELDNALIEASAILDDSCFVGELLKAGANPNTHNDDGETPLMFAASANMVSNVRTLLKAGANRKAVNILNQTAAEIAHQRGNNKVVDLLTKTQKTSD